MNKNFILFVTVTFISWSYVSSACVPATCKSKGLFCGNFSDGCNKTLTCGPPCVTITTCNGQFFGQALTVNSAPADGVPVIVAGIPVSGPLLNQLWIINGTYIRVAQNPVLILAFNGKDLRLVNSSTLTTTQLKMFQWTLGRNISGTCGTYLASLQNSRVMDAIRWSTSPSATVILYQPKPIEHASNQLWLIQRNSISGAVTFVSKQNDYALTVNGTLSDGTYVVRSPINNATGPTAKQQWTIDQGIIRSAADPNFIIGYTPYVTNVGNALRLAHTALLTATQTSSYQWIMGPRVAGNYSFIYNTAPATPVATVVPFNGVPLLELQPVGTSSSFWKSKVIY